jgi:hypothetical protein
VTRSWSRQEDQILRWIHSSALSRTQLQISESTELVVTQFIVERFIDGSEGKAAAGIYFPGTWEARSLVRSKDVVKEVDMVQIWSSGCRESGESTPVGEG